MLDDTEATTDRLRDTITNLLIDPHRRGSLAHAATAHGRPDAAEHVVTEILTAAANGSS